MVNRENFSYQEFKNEIDENFNKKMYSDFLKKHTYMTKNQMIVKLNNIIDNYTCPKLKYEKALNILSKEEVYKVTKSSSSSYPSSTSSYPSSTSSYPSSYPSYSSSTPGTTTTAPVYNPDTFTLPWQESDIHRLPPPCDERTGICEYPKEGFAININSIPIDSKVIKEYITGFGVQMHISKVLPDLDNKESPDWGIFIMNIIINLKILIYQKKGKIIFCKK